MVVNGWPSFSEQVSSRVTQTDLRRGEGGGGPGANNNGLFIPDINEDCRKRDLERIFSKYGPLKEIWLATYAPFYAFINYESKSDMEVDDGVDGLLSDCWPHFSTLARGRTGRRLPARGFASPKPSRGRVAREDVGIRQTEGEGVRLLTVLHSHFTLCR